MAYAAVGHKFREQLVGSWKTRVFQTELRITDSRLASATQAVLGQFFSSRDTSIDERHALAVANQYNLVGPEVVSVVSLARLAWTKMMKPGDAISIPHDAYLKLWSLSKPQLTKYSHIILDEAQDTNPVTAGIIESQRHANRLLIGDRHQSIYLFRGALNAMEQFAASGATVLKMPRTWRFGKGIAEQANILLGFFKSEGTEIIGAGPAGAKPAGSGIKAELSRTNAGLYEQAAHVLGKGTHWVGGIENYRLDMLLSTHQLMMGKRSEITDPVIRSYPSWSAYMNDAEASRDPEARMLINLNKEYQKGIPMLVESFKRNALPTQEGAKLVLTTAHKAKGMDWDTVKIGDDFKCLNDALVDRLANPWDALEPAVAQEINLLYVAMTRAKHTLELNKETKEFMAKLPQHVEDLMLATAREDDAAAAPISPA